MSCNGGSISALGAGGFGDLADAARKIAGGGGYSNLADAARNIAGGSGAGSLVNAAPFTGVKTTSVGLWQTCTSVTCDVVPANCKCGSGECTKAAFRDAPGKFLFISLYIRN